jgi:invasion protein IalB
MSNIEAGAAPSAAGAAEGRRNTNRMLVQIGLAVLLFVAGAIVALVADHLLGGGGNANETRIMTFQDWRIICPPAEDANASCALTQDVVRDQGGALVSLSLQDTAPGSNLTVTVPQGVLIAPGLGFAAGNDTVQTHPYETCTPVGCVAFVPLDAALLKTMQSNDKGQVVVMPTTGSPATIPYSLKGFAEGYAQLAREQSRRGGALGFLFR